MEMNLLTWIATLAVLGLGSYFLYDYILAPRFFKKTGKYVRVHLFEKIGSDIVFSGEYKGEEKNDSQLGIYLSLKSTKIVLDKVSNEDYIQDRQYTKLLQIVKFSEDDFRPLIRLRSQTFYRKENFQEEVENKKGEKQIQQITEEIPYYEPLGVTQEGREVMRFNLSYKKRMKELFGEKKNMWEKLAMPATIMVVAMVLFMSFTHMTNKSSDTNIAIAKEWGQNAQEYTDAVKSPFMAEQVMNKLMGEQKEQNAPPK